MSNQAKNKITIKGTPRQYSQSELDAKIEAAVTHYEQSPRVSTLFATASTSLF